MMNFPLSGNLSAFFQYIYLQVQYKSLTVQYKKNFSAKWISYFRKTSIPFKSFFRKKHKTCSEIICYLQSGT